MAIYRISFTLAGNFMVGSGFGLGRLVDATTVRNAETVAIIPGSTVKGRLRSMCKRLAKTLPEDYGDICQTHGTEDSTAALCKKAETRCILCRIFGSSLFPSPYFFSDFLPAETDLAAIRQQNSVHRLDHADSEWLTRVRLNRHSRRAEDKALFLFEHVPAKAQTFIGTLTGPVLQETESKLLRAGLNLLSHLGGGRSRGLGKILRHEFEQLTPNK